MKYIITSKVVCRHVTELDANSPEEVADYIKVQLKADIDPWDLEVGSIQSVSVAGKNGEWDATDDSWVVRE